MRTAVIPGGAWYRSRRSRDTARSLGDHTRFVYLREEDAAHRSPDALVHDDRRCEVIVMSGLPGARKDTCWPGGPGLPIISLDRLRDEMEIEAGEDRARAHPVPRVALDRVVHRWSPPGPAEAHRVSYIVDRGQPAWPP